MHTRSIFPAASAVFTALGINAVPAIGLLLADWSTGTAMLVYLLENLLLVGLTVARLWLLTREPGEPSDQLRRQRRELIQGFAVSGFGFSAGAAVFILGMIFLALRIPVDGAAIVSGLIGIASFQLFGFVVDLIFARGTSLDRAQAWVRASLGRVFLLFLAVFVGVFAALFGDHLFLVPFVVLKTIVDLGGQIQAVAGLRRAG